MKRNQYYKAHPSVRKENLVPQGWVCISLWKETNTIRPTIWMKGIFSATGLGVHLFMKKNQYHKAHPSVHMFMKRNQYHKAHPSERKESSVPQGWVCIYIWKETNTIRRTIWVKGIFSATGLGVHFFMKRCTPSPVALNFPFSQKGGNQYHKAHNLSERKFSATGLGVHMFMKRNQYHKAHNLSKTNIQCHRAGCAFIYEKKPIP